MQNEDTLKEVANLRPRITYKNKQLTLIKEQQKYTR